MPAPDPEASLASPNRIASYTVNHVPYTTFRAQWILANIAGSLIGLASFALIAHGITGPHDEDDRKH